ncbi:MAG: J domain-containing protein [Deltaproteobacteria bacterium]|nr:J domain-containing protein [Deltaproteobacteria bacterium]
MDPRTLTLAAEFCRLVQVSDLLTYLNLGDDASPDEVRGRLAQRRKQMQGMQSNPKYKQEALFLIKNFAKLDLIATSPNEHLEDMRRRSESTHMPVLEMTILSALSGGSLSEEQEDFLLRNALELGVSESTFREVLGRLARAHGVNLPGDAVAAEDADHFKVLGLPKTAHRAQIRAAYEARSRALQQLSDRKKVLSAQARIDRAFAQLMATETLAEEDTSDRPTGPPARNRVRTEPIDQAIFNAATMPPASQRVAGPRAIEQLSRGDLGVSTPTLVVSGPSDYSVRLRNRVVSIPVEVSLAGNRDVDAAWVHSAVEWIEVRPRQLNLDSSMQVVHLRVLPQLLPAELNRGEVSFHTNAGRAASVVVVARRSSYLIPALVGGVTSLIIALMALGWFLRT